MLLTALEENSLALKKKKKMPARVRQKVVNYYHITRQKNLRTDFAKLKGKYYVMDFYSFTYLSLLFFDILQ